MVSEPSNEALKLWQTVPADIRQMLLSNVFCGQCRGSVTMVDYHAELHGVVVLQGFCGTCGHKVARVIDDLKPAPEKRVSAAGSGLYLFDVWLYGDEQCSDEKKIIRRIQIPGSKSLFNFAKTIIAAFDFQFDHCFGFYDHLKDKRNRKKVFELFVDLGEESSAQARGVKKIAVSQAFDAVGEKLIMLFDYGDGWQFNVELKEVSKGEKGVTKAVVLDSIGTAPLQYPPCEEN
ncbi:MAG: hypothetical protein WCI27_05995 [Candidatus Omnitrophota bacterium]